MRVHRYMTVLVCWAWAPAAAQQAAAVPHYVFQQFSKGRVQQKNGSTDEAMLNYNILTREMVFEAAPGKFMALAYPEKVDTVFVMEKKFIPVNNEFYELVSSTAYSLLLQYGCSVKEPGARLGYGMTSVTTASAAVKSLVHSGGAYNLVLPDGFDIVPVYVFWIRKEGKYYKAGNTKQVLAIAPHKKEIVTAFIKKNNTDFSKRQDMIELVNQL